MSSPSGPSGVTFSDTGLAESVLAVPAMAAKYLDKIARAIMVQAAANAPVRTGFLQSSIYISTKAESTYGEGVVPGEPDSYLLEEVERPSDDETAYVAVGANYGVYVELGTRYMGAEPYLLPAAQEVAQTFSMSESELESALAAFLGL